MFHLTHASVPMEGVEPFPIVGVEGWKVFDLRGEQIGEIGQMGCCAVVTFRGEAVARINEWGKILPMFKDQFTYLPEVKEEDRVSGICVNYNGQHYSANVTLVSQTQLAGAAVCAYFLTVEEILRSIEAENEASQNGEASKLF